MPLVNGENYALSNSLLGTEGSYLSLSHWYCNFTVFFLPAVEPFLVIYDRHVSFSLGLLYFERPDEQGKGSGWMEALPPEGKQPQEVGGALPCPKLCHFFILHCCPPSGGAGFCCHWSFQWDHSLYNCYCKAVRTHRGKNCSNKQTNSAPWYLLDGN